MDTGHPPPFSEHAYCGTGVPRHGCALQTPFVISLEYLGFLFFTFLTKELGGREDVGRNDMMQALAFRTGVGDTTDMLFIFLFFTSHLRAEDGWQACSYRSFISR